ncbi:MAG: guanylate kinase [candidate division WOR-3 bacterium]
MLNLMGKSLIFILTGPSGSGKTTIRKELKKRFRNFFYSVSATTRAQRKGERNGVDYFFLSKEEFQQWQKERKFLETVKRYGNYYGTPKAPLLRALRKGKVCLMDLEPMGVKRVKKLFPERTVTILLQPPSEKELASRLKNRLPEEITLRQKEDQEVFSSVPYDYRVLNEDLKSAVDKIAEIIRKELK